MITEDVTVVTLKNDESCGMRRRVVWCKFTVDKFIYEYVALKPKTRYFSRK